MKYFIIDTLKISYVIYMIGILAALLMGICTADTYRNRGCFQENRFNAPGKVIFPSFAVGCWLVMPFEEDK